jgi:CTP synthase (UTP-ammonia lyase)
VELEPAFEAGVAEEIEIDGAVGDRQAQARVEKVRELLPEKREVQFFAFHVEILRWNG